MLTSPASSIEPLLTSCLISPHIPRHGPLTETTTLFNAEIRGEIQNAERRLLIPRVNRCHDSKRQRVARTYPKEHDLYLARDASENTISHTVDRTQHETAEGQPKSRIDLSPCHICHRKPTVRSELDAFADCEGCGRRTCYICIRECLGSTAARDAIEMNVSSFDENYDVLSFSFGDGHPMSLDGRTSRVTPRSVSGYARSMESGLDPGDDMGGRTEWDRQITEHTGMVCSRCCVERGEEGEVWCMGCLRAEEAV
jgi:hypothetical protein